MSEQLLRDKAYNAIKQKIVTLEYDMGQQLVESDISSQLDLGRTPIREAIQQLSREGLVVIIPRKGVYISDISMWEFQKLMETRVMLELYCIREAVRLITPNKIADLRKLFSHARSLTKTRNITELLDIDRKFHEGIVGVLDNPYINEIATRVYDLIVRTWYLSFKRRPVEELNKTVDEHLRILDALEAGDATVAEQAALNHLEQFQEKVFRKPFQNRMVLKTGT